MSMKKILLIGVSVFLITMLVMYMIGAFISLSINPAGWSENGKFAYAVIGTILSIGISCIVVSGIKY
jgi:hypothetical protein